VSPADPDAVMRVQACAACEQRPGCTVPRTCAEEYGSRDILILGALYAVLLAAGVAALWPSAWSWIYPVFALQSYPVILWALCSGAA
jgi:hypothetical protein